MGIDDFAKCRLSLPFCQDRTAINSERLLVFLSINKPTITLPPWLACCGWDLGTKTPFRFKGTARIPEPINTPHIVQASSLARAKTPSKPTARTPVRVPLLFQSIREIHCRGPSESSSFPVVLLLSSDPPLKVTNF